jgi:hypothetical protein
MTWLILPSVTRYMATAVSSSGHSGWQTLREPGNAGRAARQLARVRIWLFSRTNDANSR